MSDTEFVRVSTTGKVVEYLRRSIGTGDFAPGDRITELEISGKLGISRSPVREALATLAQEGVVTIIPYRGAVVSTVDAGRLAALLAFRLVLEDFALRELIANATEAAYAKIEEQIETIRVHARNRDIGASLEADLQLHQVVVSCANNPYLERTYAELLGYVALYSSPTTAEAYERLEQIGDEHDRWFDAVRRGDATHAVAMMRAHIEYGFDETLGKVRRNRG